MAKTTPESFKPTEREQRVFNRVAPVVLLWLVVGFFGVRSLHGWWVLPAFIAAPLLIVVIFNGWLARQRQQPWLTTAMQVLGRRRTPG